MEFDDDLIGNGQAEACSLSDWLGREEGFEKSRQDFVRNTDAGVGEGQLDAVPAVCPLDDELAFVGKQEAFMRILRKTWSSDAG